MPKVPCIDCGALVDKGAAQRRGRHKRASGRCPRCAAQRPYISTAETRRRAERVAQHRGAVGNWCPGWRRPPHPATDLTADHVLAVAAGGAEAGPLGVYCRQCNSSKQDSIR